TKSPCCNLTDCRPTSGRQVDGHYEVKVNGAWVSVPSGKILKQSAPDLGFTFVPLSNSTGNPITFTVSLSRQKSRSISVGRTPVRGSFNHRVGTVTGRPFRSAQPRIEPINPNRTVYAWNSPRLARI